MEQTENFGIRIDKLLKERNIKPGVFYANTGILPQELYAWRSKGRMPKTAQAIEIAAYFGTTVEYLATGKTENPLQSRVNELEAKLAQIRGLSDIS